jgi:signal transduction histidine kinase
MTKPDSRSWRTAVFSGSLGFFTTKLGTGGCGLSLSLSITHNLVTSVLAGKVHVESGAGTGTIFIFIFIFIFILQLPLRPPDVNPVTAF